MENHILIAFWQWVAIKGASFSDFALKSDLALLSKKLQIAFFQKSLHRFFLNSGFKLSTLQFKKVSKVIFHAHLFFSRYNRGYVCCGLKWFMSPCDRTFDSLARRAFGMKVDAAWFASQPPRPQRQKQPFMSRSSLIRWMGASLTGQTITRAVSISQITRRAFDVSRVTHLLDKLHT